MNRYNLNADSEAGGSFGNSLEAMPGRPDDYLNFNTLKFYRYDKKVPVHFTKTIFPEFGMRNKMGFIVAAGLLEWMQSAALYKPIGGSGIAHLQFRFLLFSLFA